MYLLQEIGIECPYCAEPVEIVVDASVDQQQYIEDCPVCCRPMQLSIQVSDEGEIQVRARDENSC